MQAVASDVPVLHSDEINGILVGVGNIAVFDVNVLALVDLDRLVGIVLAAPIDHRPADQQVVTALAMEGIPSSQDRDKSIHVLTIGPGATFVEKMRIPIEDARTDPDGLLVADANQDGLPDILLFTPYQEMRIFKQTADRKFIDVSRGPDYGKGLVQGVTRRSVSIADLKGDGKPTILVAAKSFARALRLDEKDRIEIVEQFNGLAPTSQIVAACPVRLNGGPSTIAQGRPEESRMGGAATDVLLADAANHCLTVLRANKTGVYEIVDKLQTGAVNLERLHVADLDGSGKPAIILVGQNDFHILRPGTPRLALRSIASYESPVRNGRLENVEVGDLRGDGRPQIIVTEGTKQLMELLTWRKEEPRIERALAWPVSRPRRFPAAAWGPPRRPPRSRASSPSAPSPAALRQSLRAAPPSALRLRLEERNLEWAASPTSCCSSTTGFSFTSRSDEKNLARSRGL